MFMSIQFGEKVGLFLLLVLAIEIGGCNDAQPMQQRAVRAAKVKSVRAPVDAGLAVRAVGDHYEIEVTSQAGFPPSGLDPVLHVGAVTFVRYAYSATAGLFGVVYTVSATEFATLVDGAEVYVDHGRGGGREQFGIFNRSMVP